MLRQGFALLAILLMAPSQALAFRPFTTDDAIPTEHRKLGLELGWDWSRRHDDVWEGIVLGSLKYGLLPRTEVGLDVPWVLVDQPGAATPAGIGDMTASVKLLARRQSPRLPALALRGAYKSSSGSASRGLGSGDDDLLFSGSATKTWGGHSVHAMLGRAWVGRRSDGSLRDNTFYGAGGDYELNAEFSVLAEVFGSSPIDWDEAGGPATLRIGTIYTHSKRLCLDASARLRLNSPSHHWGVSLGLTAALF